MVNKEVLQQALIVRPTRAVATAGHRKQVEVLVCFDERIRNLQRGRRVNVRIQFTIDEQQFALKFGGVVHVG